MPLVTLTIVMVATLALINLLVLPLDWLSALSLPTWLYLAGALALLSWCLDD
ncbi:hypothetical protein H6F86_28860 [Phormidium sp. FACHB-592]|uniref:Uncharacterized protein n=1 Tax=Stenomitos frigidus AS-A4 TaxID=2933935 RepID=A0ABV0KDT3_9CYAN|nr:hypothetical protein [Phormidium sp. FACHB-592]